MVIDWLERVARWSAHASPRAVGVPLLALLAVLAYRLLAERGRRKTLRETYLYAPKGTVVFLGHGPGGPATWVRLGDGPRPRPHAIGRS